jgi:hypothetical protein
MRRVPIKPRVRCAAEIWPVGHLRRRDQERCHRALAIERFGAR